MEKAIFSITCTTCQVRLAVRSEAAIGAILECPKCQSMVHVVPPEGWVSRRALLSAAGQMAAGRSGGRRRLAGPANRAARHRSALRRSIGSRWAIRPRAGTGQLVAACMDICPSVAAGHVHCVASSLLRAMVRDGTPADGCYRARGTAGLGCFARDEAAGSPVAGSREEIAAARDCARRSNSADACGAAGTNRPTARSPLNTSRPGPPLRNHPRRRLTSRRHRSFLSVRPCRPAALAQPAAQRSPLRARQCRESRAARTARPAERPLFPPRSR